MLWAIVGTAIMWIVMYSLYTLYCWWVHGDEDELLVPLLKKKR